MDFVTFLSQLYGKGEETANKLRSVGLTTPARLRTITPEELGNLADISVSSAKGMIDTAKGMLQQDEKERKHQLMEIEGIGAKRAKKLRRAGLHTIRQ